MKRGIPYEGLGRERQPPKWGRVERSIQPFSSASWRLNMGGRADLSLSGGERGSRIS